MLEGPDIDWDGESVNVVSAKSGREGPGFLHEASAAQMATYRGHPKGAFGPDGTRDLVSVTGAKTDYTDSNHVIKLAAAEAWLKLGNSPSTCNVRLAAIHWLVAASTLYRPEHSGGIARIPAIPARKTPKPDLCFLHPDETAA